MTLKFINLKVYDSQIYKSLIYRSKVYDSQISKFQVYFHYGSLSLCLFTSYCISIIFTSINSIQEFLKNYVTCWQIAVRN